MALHPLNLKAHRTRRAVNATTKQKTTKKCTVCEIPLASPLSEKMYILFRYLDVAAFGRPGGLRVFPNHQLDGAGHFLATAATANEERIVFPFHLLVELCIRGHEERDNLMLA